MKRQHVTFIVCLIVLWAGTAGAVEQGAKLSEPFTTSTGVEGGFPQYYPEVAWAAQSRTWLVVWEDGYTTGDETERDGRAKDIFASRVSADGNVLDPNGILVCTAKDFQGRPCVASDGKDFLVVWHDMRNGRDHDLYAARVSAEGKVLDKDGFLVSGGAHNQCFPDLVYGGGSYYAVWLDARHFPPEYRVYGARVSAGGKVLNPQGIEVIRLLTDEKVRAWAKSPFGGHNKNVTGWAEYSRQPGPPSVATDGERHVVAAHIQHVGSDYLARYPDYVVRQVDASSGRPSDPPQMLYIYPTARYGKWKKDNYGDMAAKAAGTMTRAGRPYLVHTGEKGFLIAVSSYFPAGWGAKGDVFWFAAFLDPEGTVLLEGKKDVLLRLVYGDDGQQQHGSRGHGLRTNRLALAWDGKHALYVSDRYVYLNERGKGGKKGRGFIGDHDVLGILVNEEGKRIADFATGEVVEPDKLDGAKCKNNLVYASPPKITPFMLATGEALQTNPAAAAGPEGTFLVVWQEETSERYARITGRLVRVP